MILSSKPVNRVWPYATMRGSKLPFRARRFQLDSLKSPLRLFFVFPFLEFRL